MIQELKCDPVKFRLDLRTSIGQFGGTVPSIGSLQRKRTLPIFTKAFYAGGVNGSTDFNRKKKKTQVSLPVCQDL